MELKLIEKLKVAYPNHKNILIRNQSIFILKGNKPRFKNIMNISFDMFTIYLEDESFDESNFEAAKIAIKDIRVAIANEVVRIPEQPLEFEETILPDFLSKTEVNLVKDIIADNEGNYQDLIDSSDRDDFIRVLHTIYEELTKPYKLWRRINDYQKKNNLGW